jgi:hypothetical protein
MRNIFLLIFFIGIMLFAACKKDAAKPINLGYNYVPLAKGNYIIYDVDSIYFDEFQKTTDTFKFQLKEEIGDSFADLTGKISYQYKRFKRYYKTNVDIDKTAWCLTDVWYVRKLKERYERIEESIKYSRLIFPVTETKKWNGNSFNNMPEWMYELQNVDTKYTIGALTFDSTATILQRDYTSKLSRQYYKETFARNIGLIYKKVIDVKSENVSGQIYIMDKIESGVIYEWRYLSHGKIK